MSKKAQAEKATIAARARAVLEFAEERANAGCDWLKLQADLFGVRGKATHVFTTEAERTAFCKTKEYKRILALISRLPRPPVTGAMNWPISSGNGRGSRPQSSKRK
jgi:hypothetical protein